MFPCSKWTIQADPNQRSCIHTHIHTHTQLASKETANKMSEYNRGKIIFKGIQEKRAWYKK